MSIRAIAGPTPRRYQSGETDIWGESADAAASWRAPRSHEVTLYEAAHSLLTRGQKRPALRAWGMKIANRRGMAKARMAVARKLATILHRMGVDATGFRFGREQLSSRHRCDLGRSGLPRKAAVVKSSAPRTSIVPVGTAGEAILVASPEPEGERPKGRANGTPCSPDPIMRRSPRRPRREASDRWERKHRRQSEPGAEVGPA
jgi:hypothetical protein